MQKALLPLAWLYGIGTGLRNKLFDWGILQSKSFDIPIICVGNLAVGGTGKTPHTEYLIRLLQSEGLNVATLSRGYKRHTKGYLLANEHSTAHDIGDEPYQMKQKFPDIRVAVDENRCHGIEQLMKVTNPPIDVIIMDDAYQHRYAKAGYYLLLTDFNCPYFSDALMPAGRLRETSKGKQRANAIVMTKCPNHLHETDYEAMTSKLKAAEHQPVFFSRFRYGELKPLFALTNETLENKQVLLVAGIAQPQPLFEEVSRKAEKVEMLAFADHHDFTEKEMQLISNKFMQLEEGRRIIVTTEKDAARLAHHPALDKSLHPHIYVLPIEVEILQNKQNTFNLNIIEYVRANSRNSCLPKE